MAHFVTPPTPNPNSLKITTHLGTFIEQGMESFGAPAQAEGHPLGAPLFSVTGVTNVFILPQFLTVTKATDADWDVILPMVNEILSAHFLK